MPILSYFSARHTIFKDVVYIEPFIQPDREDEHARIEAAGGKVIQWKGSRVFGVLAMSRSIGTCLQ